MIFKDGVEEMMRTGSCFTTLFHVNSWLHISKEASKSNPLLVYLHTPEFGHCNILLCIRKHTKCFTLWHPKVIASAAKQHLSDQSLHPFHPPLLELVILDPHKNHSKCSGHSPILVFSTFKQKHCVIRLRHCSYIIPSKLD